MLLHVVFISFAWFIGKPTNGSAEDSSRAVDFVPIIFTITTQ